jgi:ribosomal protein L12E/L44/L45/RPP1/RPP2
MAENSIECKILKHLLKDKEITKSAPHTAPTQTPPEAEKEPTPEIKETEEKKEPAPEESKDMPVEAPKIWHT